MLWDRVPFLVEVAVGIVAIVILSGSVRNHPIHAIGIIGFLIVMKPSLYFTI